MAAAFILQSTGIAGSVPNFAGAGNILPAAGTMVGLSEAVQPPVLKGVKVYADEPFRFDFILDQGDRNPVGSVSSDELSSEANKLIRYFLASLTVPEKDLWVNLSPFENDRIITNEFGQTEMGRDLLAQDYLLKQLTASVIYPEGETGKKFWAEVYQKAYEKFGTTDIPVDTFNKVWIVPDKAVVYEKAQGTGHQPQGSAAMVPGSAVAYVVNARLKVMLESDYLASGKACASGSPCPVPGAAASESQKLAKDVLRDVVIPVLEREVNEGVNFSQLRQVYYSLVLAAWYKRKVKASLLGKVYVDQKKVTGVNINDPQMSERIWEQYVAAFKKGAYNYIKEEQDRFTGETIPRKYFSGGILGDMAQALMVTEDAAALPLGIPQRTLVVKADVRPPDQAMVNHANPEFEKKVVQPILEVLKRKRDASGDKNGGQILTIEGIPGSGKTSIIGYLRSRGLAGYEIVSLDTADDFIAATDPGFLEDYWKKINNVRRPRTLVLIEAVDAQPFLIGQNSKNVVRVMVDLPLERALAQAQARDGNTFNIKDVYEHLQHAGFGSFDVVLKEVPNVPQNGTEENASASRAVANSTDRLPKDAFTPEGSYLPKNWVGRSEPSDRAMTGDKGKPLQRPGVDLSSPLIKSVKSRRQVIYDLLVSFLNMDHPLKTEIFSRVDRKLDGLSPAEIVGVMDQVLRLPKEEKGVHVYDREVTTRELFLRPSQGQGSDVIQAVMTKLDSVRDHEAIELALEIGMEASARLTLEHCYLLFRALEALGSNDMVLFREEDSYPGSPYFKYLVSGDVVQDGRVPNENLRDFLSFSSLLVNELLGPDREGMGLDNVRQAMVDPGKDKVRESVVNYVRLVQSLQAKSLPWKTALGGDWIGLDKTWKGYLQDLAWLEEVVDRAMGAGQSVVLTKQSENVTAQEEETLRGLLGSLSLRIQRMFRYNLEYFVPLLRKGSQEAALQAMQKAAETEQAKVSAYPVKLKVGIQDLVSQIIKDKTSKDKTITIKSIGPGSRPQEILDALETIKEQLLKANEQAEAWTVVVYVYDANLTNLIEAEQVITILGPPHGFAIQLHCRFGDVTDRKVHGAYLFGPDSTSDIIFYRRVTAGAATPQFEKEPGFRESLLGNLTDVGVAIVNDRKKEQVFSRDGRALQTVDIADRAMAEEFSSQPGALGKVNISNIILTLVRSWNAAQTKNREARKIVTKLHSNMVAAGINPDNLRNALSTILEFAGEGTPKGGSFNIELVPGDIPDGVPGQPPVRGIVLRVMSMGTALQERLTEDELRLSAGLDPFLKPMGAEWKIEYQFLQGAGLVKTVTVGFQAADRSMGTKLDAKNDQTMTATLSDTQIRDQLGIKELDWGFITRVSAMRMNGYSIHYDPDNSRSNLEAPARDLPIDEFKIIDPLAKGPSEIGSLQLSPWEASGYRDAEGKIRFTIRWIGLFTDYQNHGAYVSFLKQFDAGTQVQLSDVINQLTLVGVAELVIKQLQESQQETFLKEQAAVLEKLPLLRTLAEENADHRDYAAEKQVLSFLEAYQNLAAEKGLPSLLDIINKKPKKDKPKFPMVDGARDAGYEVTNARVNRTTDMEEREFLNFDLIIKKTDRAMTPVTELDGKIWLDETTGRIQLGEEPVVQTEFELWGVRHGETYGNRNSIFQGQVDGELNQLTENGKARAVEAARDLFEKLKTKILAGEEIIVIVSPRQRAVDTAEPFIRMVREAGGKVRVIEEEEIRQGADEIDFGYCDNKTEAELATAEGKAFAERYRRGLDATAHPGSRITEQGELKKGESFLDLLVRVKPWLLRLNGLFKGRTVVVFGHGTHMSAVRALLGDTSLFDATGNIDWRGKMLSNAGAVQLATADAAMDAAVTLLSSGNKNISVAEPSGLARARKTPFPGPVEVVPGISLSAPQFEDLPEERLDLADVLSELNRQMEGYYKEAQEVYEKAHKEISTHIGSIFKHDNLFYLLKKYVRTFEGKTVLEVGSHEGSLLLALMAMGVRDVHGMEVDPNLVKFAQQKGLPVFEGNLRWPTPEMLKGSYDVVISNAVLEVMTRMTLDFDTQVYIPRLERGLMHLASFVKPGGISIHVTSGFPVIDLGEVDWKKLGFEVLETGPAMYGSFVVLRRTEEPASAVLERFQADRAMGTGDSPWQAADILSEKDILRVAAENGIVVGDKKIVLHVAGSMKGTQTYRLYNEELLKDQGVDIVMIPYQIRDDQFAQLLEVVRRSSRIMGINVGAPFKTMVSPYVVEKNDPLAWLGFDAVIKKADGTFNGFRFGGQAWVNAFKDEGYGSLAGKNVVILGAGATGSAIAAALIPEGVNSITFTEEAPERRDLVRARFLEVSGGKAVAILAPDSPELPGVLNRADYVINATGLGKDGLLSGLSPIAENMELPRRAVVFDLNYHPQVTKFMEIAAAKGIRTVNGAGMNAATDTLQSATDIREIKGLVPDQDTLYSRAKGFMKRLEEEDNAMGKENGGIDLASAQKGLEVQNSGAGAAFQFAPGAVQDVKIDGLTPVIIDIAPMTMSVAEFAGVREPAGAPR